MRHTYDDQADALYVLLAEGVPVTRSIVVDDARVVDLGTEELPVGIEVLGASRGVRLLDLVERFGLQEFEERLRMLEDTSFQRVTLAAR